MALACTVAARMLRRVAAAASKHARLQLGCSRASRCRELRGRRLACIIAARAQCRAVALKDARLQHCCPRATQSLRLRGMAAEPLSFTLVCSVAGRRAEGFAG